MIIDKKEIDMSALKSSKNKPNVNWQMLLSAAIGGLFCILSDIIKNNRSLVVYLKDTLQSNFEIPSFLCLLLLIIILPLLSVGLCFIFEPSKKVQAFYIGASILAVAFNFVPQKEYDQLIMTKHSAKVIIRFPEKQMEQIHEVVVTVDSLVEDDKYGTVGRTIFTDIDNIFFYLKKGNYKIWIEVTGYWITYRKVSINNDFDKPVGFKLKKSIIPIGLQKMLK